MSPAAACFRELAQGGGLRRVAVAVVRLGVVGFEVDFVDAHPYSHRLSNWLYALGGAGAAGFLAAEAIALAVRAALLAQADAIAPSEEARAAATLTFE